MEFQYYFLNGHAVCDRKKKKEITLVQEDFDEIKHEHEINQTHSTIFTIGLSQFMLRPKLRETATVSTSFYG